MPVHPLPTRRHQFSQFQIVASLGLAVLALAPAAASERLFTYTSQSDVLAEGEHEAELWTTVRHGRLGYYHAVDTRLELEIGVAPGWMAAAYLNWSSATETDPATDITTHTSEVQGASFEVVRKFSDASADLVGFALYTEATLGSEENEYEVKAIADKRLGRGLAAMNLVYALEQENDGHHGRPEHEFGLNLAYSHPVGTGLAVGLEARLVSAFIHDDQRGSWRAEYATLYAGPAVHFSRGQFWATLTFTPQLHAFVNDTGSDQAGKNLELEHQERWHARLIVGTHF